MKDQNVTMQFLRKRNVFRFEFPESIIFAMQEATGECDGHAIQRIFETFAQLFCEEYCVKKGGAKKGKRIPKQ